MCLVNCIPSDIDVGLGSPSSIPTDQEYLVLLPSPLLTSHVTPASHFITCGFIYDAGGTTSAQRWSRHHRGCWDRGKALLTVSLPA